MTTSRRRSFREPSLLTKVLLQLAAIGILITVLFPIIWVFSVSLSPLPLIRPAGLNLIPKDATFEAYLQVIERPTSNPVSFFELAFNSMKIAGGTALMLMNCASNASAIRRAMVVLPVPGGPHRMQLCG